MKLIISILLITFSIHIAYSQTTNQRAEMLMMQGQRALQWGYFEKAAEYFEKATLTDPKYSEAFYYWGTTLAAIAQRDEDENQYTEAFKKYRKATELNPQMTSAYNDWGCALMQLGKTNNKLKRYSPEAERHLKKAEEMGQQMAAYNLGCLYSLLNNRAKAIEWLDTMMKKDYSDKFANISREIFDNDEDFENIRQSDEFIQFLNTNFPDDLPDNFQVI